MVSGRVDLDVDFPLASPTANKPARVEIIQQNFHHDMAVLTYYVQNDWWKNRFRNGAPVLVTWGYVPRNLEHFYGHVLFAIPHLENERHSLRVVCIGASLRLKGIEPAAHENLSVEQSIALTLRNKKFSLVTDKASRSWPRLTRTVHESLLEYMVRMAQRVGYTFFVNKTTVCLYNPIDVLLANSASYPTFDYIYGRGNQRGTLVTFTAHLSDDGTAREQNREQRGFGVDPRTGRIIEVRDGGEKMRRLNNVSSTPKFASYMGGTPIHSGGEGQAVVSGARRASRWTMKAKARAYGNVRVTQGSGAVIRGINGQDDGLWFVDKVVHELSTDDHPQQWTYFMDMDLLRDSRQAGASVPRHDRPLRPLISVTDLATNRQANAPRLVNGHWVAPHTKLIEVAV